MPRPKIEKEEQIPIGKTGNRQDITSEEFTIKFTGSSFNVTRAMNVLYVYMVDGGLNENIENHLIGNGVNAQIGNSSQSEQIFNV